MKTNLIQARTSTSPMVQQYNNNRAAKNFDIDKELSTHTFIKPLPSNGYLVKNNIFDAPAQYFKDLKYDLKSVKHAVSGKANDHELGRINDVGMKAGGLAIATYLFTKKGTPLPKLMEFVGLGTFFAAMDIWPKLALQLPAYLIHGVNVRQHYVDNYGRKKLFYLDNQFIPWDLYSDSEINKIGDKMGVPKDMKNRRAHIQEKMRRIALQNNTMWMLTSGFATPIMSALMCDMLKNPIAKFQEKQLERETKKILINLKNDADKIDYSKEITELDEILKSAQGKPVDAKLIDRLASSLSSNLNPKVEAAVKADIEHMFAQSGTYNVSEGNIDEVLKVIRNQFQKSGFNDYVLSRVIPDKDAIRFAFQNEGLINGEVRDFSKHSKVIQNLLSENIEKYLESHPDDKVLRDKLKMQQMKLIHTSRHGESSAITKALATTPSQILSEHHVKSIKEIGEVLRGFSAKFSRLCDYAYKKGAQASETLLADSWNSITEGLLKTFEFTPEEISKSRYDREIAGKILREKFEKIASNDDLYKKTIQDICKKLATLPAEKVFESFEVAQLGDVEYSNVVDDVFNNAKQGLYSKGMSRTADILVGHGFEGAGSLKSIQKGFLLDRVRGVKSSFYRILNTLDVYRRIATMTNLGVLLNSNKDNIIIPRGVKEEIIEMCKQILIEGHSADYSTKFYARRNPDLNSAHNDKYYADVVVKDGKVIDSNALSKEASNLIELSNDKTFFQRVMQVLYSQQLHPDTQTTIQDCTDVKIDFNAYRQNIFKYIGGLDYFAHPEHVTGSKVPSTSEFRNLLMGCAPDEMFCKLCKQQFNNKTWLKPFGIIGGVLLGVTVLSQFFFGHMPKAKNKENA